MVAGKRRFVVVAVDTEFEGFFRLGLTCGLGQRDRVDRVAGHRVTIGSVVNQFQVVAGGQVFAPAFPAVDRVGKRTVGPDALDFGNDVSGLHVRRQGRRVSQVVERGTKIQRDDHVRVLREDIIERNLAEESGFAVTRILCIQVAVGVGIGLGSRDDQVTVVVAPDITERIAFPTGVAVRVTRGELEGNVVSGVEVIDLDNLRVDVRIDDVRQQRICRRIPSVETA